MQFKHELLTTPYELTQVTLPSGRYYKDSSLNESEIVKYPSITTVLGHMDKTDWSKVPEYIRRRAAARGTWMHAFCEDYVMNELELPIPRMENLAHSDVYDTGKILFYQLQHYIDKSIEAVYMCESQLKSEKYRIAGTVDLFCRIKGKNVVVDFKSSTNRKKESDIGGYFSQGCFYASAIEETFNLPVDGVMILISTENEGVQTFYIQNESEKMNKYKKYLKEARKHYYKTKGL